MIVRRAEPADATALAVVLNEIIAVGGTTAHAEPFSDTYFQSHYIDGPDAMCCHLAQVEGQMLGFQALGIYPALPKGWLDVGTFVRSTARGTGAGAALFAATCGVARAGGCAVINATIRADNGLGLGFYTRLGFKDYAFDPDFALKDGRVVGRISKRFDL